MKFFPQRIIIILLISVLWSSSSLSTDLVPPPPKVAGLAEVYAHPVFPTKSTILAIIQVESVYKERAVNGKAKGLMQVEGGSYQPAKNIKQGVSLLRKLYIKLGFSEKNAIVAYNIGEGNFSNGLLSKRGEKYFKQVDKLRREHEAIAYRSSDSSSNILVFKGSNGLVDDTGSMDINFNRENCEGC